MTDKRTLRAQMRSMRQALSGEAQRLAAGAVCERILALDAYKKAACVMAYAACRGEIDLTAVMEDIWRSGRTLALPRCESPGVMTARRIQSFSQLAPGVFGLMEPAQDAPVVPMEEIDLIFVPGTAFDRALYRLGQGGGYYDRFLNGTSAVRIGVCHDGALLERVPREAHDAQMDAVITPGTLLNGRK